MEEATADAHDTARSMLFGSGLASLGAGAIHAAAIGVHSDHRQAVYAFTAIAALQLGWGVLAVLRGSRPVAVLGVLIQGAALGGWVMAKASGIGFIDGLDVAEKVQFADGVAAALAAASVVLALPVLLAPAADSVPRRSRPLLSSGLARGAVTVAVVIVAFSAMVKAGGHSHAAGHDEAGGHSHGDSSAQAAGHEHSGAQGADHHGTGAGPTAYDPTKPIDLSGTPGVTAEQQAAAENLIAVTLADLPQFADPKVAEARGYRSIGDAITGHEHFINWNYIDDEHTLDPDYPESLVYETHDFGRTRKLVSAMFMLPTGTSLDDVPELGGKLTQWHIHDDLCFTGGPSPQVRGITTVGGSCPPPLKKLEPVPMIHVWITPHPCGPFAALEGVGAGQIEDGEERLCDTAHGHGG